MPYQMGMAPPDLREAIGGFSENSQQIAPTSREATWFWVRNDAGEDIQEYMFISIERIGDTSVDGAVYKAKKPTADSQKNFAITLHKIPAGQIGRASTFGHDNGLTLRYSGTVPTVGDTIGTKNGQYEGKAGNKGCVVLGLDTAEGLCFVRPF